MNIDARQVTIQAVSTSNTVITAGDTAEQAAGKTQGQINSINATKADKTTSIINALIFG
jgi:hypothetical protein